MSAPAAAARCLSALGLAGSQGRELNKCASSSLPEDPHNIAKATMGPTERKAIRRARLIDRPTGRQIDTLLVLNPLATRPNRTLEKEPSIWPVAVDGARH